ncbi:MAG TPA: S8 family serine peptidase, partial [Gemmatimonadaceae bacterium]|nr:S8 family serine peptidase [Gemmatimonadaceae bacterium]
MIGVNTTQSPFALASRRPSTPSGIAAQRTRAARSLAVASTKPRYTRNRIIVGFKDDALGVAAAASAAYRSMATAQATSATIRATLSTLMHGRPLSALTVSPALLAARLRVDDPTHMQSLMDSLRADPSVAYVEREELRSNPKLPFKPASSLGWAAKLQTALRSLGAPPSGARSTATALPNDPDLLLQYWNYNMLELPKAWTITTGSAAVTVAVVDQGIRFDHPGIAANLTHDGYDFVSQITLFDLGLTADSTAQVICGGGTFTTIDGDGNGPDPDPTDPNDVDYDADDNCWQPSEAGDHGLWTAGIIGEAGNDGQYGNGVNWTVRIRPIRVLGIAEGVGTDFDIAQGILYAAGLPATGANGAMVQAPRSPIINLSIGGAGSSRTLQSAVTAAVNAGSLLVAAAGNDADDIPSYPAAYSGVISVSAVGPDGTIALYSNVGTSVSLAAPGGDSRFDDPFDDPFNELGSDTGGSLIWGLWWDFTTGSPTFAGAEGTSAAAPHVAGVAALLLSQNPSMSASDLTTRLEQTATRPAGDTRNDTFGWGIVDGYHALLGPNAPARAQYARLISTATGATIKTVKADANGGFSFAQLASGSYYVQAGEDEAGDGIIGTPGRRFTWAGGFESPTVFATSIETQAATIVLGMPTELEPNDDTTSANYLSVGSYVVGSITAPDLR